MTKIRCSKCQRKVPLKDAALHERVCGGILDRRERKRRNKKTKPAVLSKPRSQWAVLEKKQEQKRPLQGRSSQILAELTKAGRSAPKLDTPPNAAPSAPSEPEYITCECGRRVKRDLMALHLERICPKRNCDDAPFNIPVTDLPFELLPPGTWRIDDVIKYYERHETRSAPGGQEIDKQRIISLAKLDPIRCSRGKSKWHGYHLFEFDWSVAVVLECPITRNATYILSSNWRTMVRESKRCLLTKFAQHTTRVVHKGDWLTRIRRTLQQHPASAPRLTLD